MKTIDIHASKRSESEIGKTGSKALRTSDTVPCVVYLNGQATPIKVPTKEMMKVLLTPETYLINILFENGEAIQAVEKHSDYHPVTGKVLHVEMMQVVANKPIEVSLPVKLTGTAVGVTKGGKLMQKLRKIKVKGLAKDLPAVVEINVSKLDLGGNIQVKDVPFENIDIKSPSSAAVASVEIPRSLRSQMKGK